MGTFDTLTGKSCICKSGKTTENRNNSFLETVARLSTVHSTMLNAGLLTLVFPLDDRLSIKPPKYGVYYWTYVFFPLKYHMSGNDVGSIQTT